MNKEIIFIDTTRNLEFYSDGTSNVSREQLQRLEQENEFLIKKYVASLKDNEAKTLSWLEFQGCKKENEKLKETCDGLLKIQYALADESKKFEGALEEIREQLKAVSYLAPLSTRSLKYAIEGIINEVLDERNFKEEEE